MPSLKERLEALPAELYDEIKELTFTLDANVIEITSKYKPPVQLHVDSASRKKALASLNYFFTEENLQQGAKWLNSLNRTKFNCPASIRYRICGKFKPDFIMSHHDSTSVCLRVPSELKGVTNPNITQFLLFQEGQDDGGRSFWFSEMHWSLHNLLVMLD